MARPPDPIRRQELLDQVVRYLADHGLAGASLRPMAKALGVSLNGLVHHFGTKTDLLVAARIYASLPDGRLTDEALPPALRGHISALSPKYPSRSVDSAPPAVGTPRPRRHRPARQAT